MTTPVQKRPGALQVAVAWLQSLPDLAGVPVATTLPQPKTWGGQDFVTATAILGGMPNAYEATRVPVVQIDAWAVAPSSSHPAWNRASITAEAIYDGCYGSYQSGTLSFPGGFMSVDLHGVIPTAGPTRIGNDPAAVARYMVTLRFSFTPVGLVFA